jgi:hypothetical protein
MKLCFAGFCATRIRIVTLVFLLAFPSKAPGQNPADAFQEMFERFAKQSNAFMPGFFGELSDEQLETLSRVQVSIAEEQKFGKQVIDRFADDCKKKGIALTQDGKDIDYLQELCRSLKSEMKNGKRYSKLDIRIIENDSSDAFSIPGGRILVTRGLLDTVESEAAIVGVLGHELSHLDRGHQLLPLKQSKLTSRSIDFRDQMEWMMVIFKPFRPEFEMQADSDAVQWMMKLQYDAKELSKLLDSWDQRQDRQMPWMNFIPGFVKSHPDAGKRAQRVLELSADLSRQYPRANYVGVRNLKLRIPFSKQRF